MKITRCSLLVCMIILYGCGAQTPAAPPTAVIVSPTAIAMPTQTPTETPTVQTILSIAPDSTADPTIFGAIGQNEIQAFSLEPIANAIFSKTFDSFIADGRIQEYQVTGVTIFSGSDGLLSEIIFNVRTPDMTWLESDGTQAADNWINGKCYRFDFVTTETEYQLKNRRTCN